VDKLSRDVDDAREEAIRQIDAWKAAERKLRISLETSEKEHAELIKARASLTTEVHQLRRENIFLVENLKTQSRAAKEAKKEADTLREDFDTVNYDVFCNCLQQVMLLNPGMQLNLRGLSVDHTMSEGVVTDICQPSDLRPVDLSNPNLKVFDPWAPYVANDSEETKSDV
jgi:nicotinamidase-related amidase